MIHLIKGLTRFLYRVILKIWLVPVQTHKKRPAKWQALHKIVKYCLGDRQLVQQRGHIVNKASAQFCKQGA